MEPGQCSWRVAQNRDILPHFTKEHDSFDQWGSHNPEEELGEEQGHTEESSGSGPEEAW